jgi:hypothetical protein
MYSVYSDRLLTCRIAPFRHLRIEACLQLPEAFRSLPRLSSALGAKAFTLCSCSLDHYVIFWFSLFGNCSIFTQYKYQISTILLFSFAVFIVQFSMCIAPLYGAGGLKWTRTTDLALIRRTL